MAAIATILIILLILLRISCYNIDSKINLVRTENRLNMEQNCKLFNLLAEWLSTEIVLSIKAIEADRRRSAKLPKYRKPHREDHLSRSSRRRCIAKSVQPTLDKA